MQSFKRYITEARELPEKFWYNVHTKKLHSLGYDDEHFDFVVNHPEIFPDLPKRKTYDMAFDQPWHNLVHHVMKQGWVRGGNEKSGAYLQSYSLDHMHKTVKRLNSYPLRKLSVETSDDPKVVKYGHLTSRKDINNFIETKHMTFHAHARASDAQL